MKTKAITAISNATADALSQYENFPRSKIKTIYNGIGDLSQLVSHKSDIQSEFKIYDNKIVLGTVSRLDPIKNQGMMIKALKNIQAIYPNTILLIVGDGPAKSELVNSAKNIGLQHSVFFTGYRLNAHEYINIMDIFLLPSLSEGTSMTLLEAMSLSKPCVVTDVGGNPEIVMDGITGFVVPNNDIDLFSRAILNLIENKPLRSKMGYEGRQRFETYFSSAKMASEYEKLYQEVLTVR